tara:strand:+ start:192 stop:929 length:738 start_codon:yes stop_codon:yes gene_type:complete
MSSFYTMANRLSNEQKVEGAELKARLGIDITQELQNITAAQRTYQEQVEEAERQMAENERRRGRRGLFGTLLGAALSFTPLGAVGGAVIGGLASGLGRGSVSPYSGTIMNTLPGGKFHSESRKDLSSAIDATNSWISDAAEGQSLLNWTNALGDATTVYQFGKEVPSIKEGFRNWAVGKPTGGEIDASGNIINVDDLKYEGGISNKFREKMFKGKFGERMRKNQLGKYKEKLLNERLRQSLLGEI